VNAIQINVAQQIKEPVGSVRHYDIDESAQEGFSVRGSVQLLRTNRSILVTGRLETTHRDTCSRCLEEFDHLLTLDIEEEYMLPKNTADSPSPAPQGEAGTFAIDEDNILDLSEAVRQYTVVALPMKPVCQPDCAGLCTQCGSNLNDVKCDCVPVRPDSPWAALQGLVSRE
jgi:uncharacterized protein